MKVFISPQRRRRGAAIVLILILAIFLAGVMAVLSATVGYGYLGANERRDMQESLANSDDVSERLAHDMQFSDSADPVDSLLTYEDLVDSGGTTVAGNRDWYGYFEAVAANEALDTIQLYYDANGATVGTVGAATWSVRLSSAYRTWRNDDVDLVLNESLNPASPLPFPRVLNADRISLVEPLYDYYVASVDNAPNIANNPGVGLNLRQAQIVFRAEKPYYPSALYLDGGDLTVTSGVVDGRDHQDVAVEESYFVVPFSSKIKIGDLPAGSAGYHHSLHYTDPVSGDEETLFNDSHSVWSNPSSVEGNYLEDASGNDIVFSTDSPLDFYIHTWQGNDTTHHLFGNHIFAPGNTHHGKRYGYAWNEILHIKSSAINDATKRAALGDAIYSWLKESDQVSKYGGDLTDLISNAAAFKADPLNGSDKIQTYGVDNDGDGSVEVDDDVDDNGALNRWTSGDSPLSGYDKAGIIEDRNNNGVRDDDDRRLAKAMHDYFYSLQNDADSGNDAIQKLELVMGFEDLDVEVGENPDWDFNDVFLILDSSGLRRPSSARAGAPGSESRRGSAQSAARDGSRRGMLEGTAVGDPLEDRAQLRLQVAGRLERLARVADVRVALDGDVARHHDRAEDPGTAADVSVDRHVAAHDDAAAPDDVVGDQEVTLDDQDALALNAAVEHGRGAARVLDMHHGRVAAVAGVARADVGVDVAARGDGGHARRGQEGVHQLDVGGLLGLEGVVPVDVVEGHVVALILVGRADHGRVRGGHGARVSGPGLTRDHRVDAGHAVEAGRVRLIEVRVAVGVEPRS